MSIEIRDVSKTFGQLSGAFGHVSLTVQTGELVALLGPSGSGKTTLLRIIAGLEFAYAGVYLIQRRRRLGNKDARARRVGFVFQHYALFRHMSIFENVAFGLRVRPRATRPSKAEIKARVLELLHLVQLEGLAERYPSQLSGGQRQRVALARALAVEPSVLLLDEPFGALDARVRQELRTWLRHLHDDLHITSVFVTHDQEEALEVADRIVVMNQGKIEQIGTPDDVYEHPANPFVMKFPRQRQCLSRAYARRRRFPRPLRPCRLQRAMSGPMSLKSRDIVLRRRHRRSSLEVVVRYISTRSAQPCAWSWSRATAAALSAELTRERFQALGHSNRRDGVRDAAQAANLRTNSIRSLGPSASPRHLGASPTLSLSKERVNVFGGLASICCLLPTLSLPPSAGVSASWNSLRYSTAPQTPTSPARTSKPPCQNCGSARSTPTRAISCCGVRLPPSASIWRYFSANAGPSRFAC